MNDIFESLAFQEFLQKRCEEVIEKDAIYVKLNHEILKLEQELFPMLPKEALDKALKIDELTMELIDHIRTLLCR